MKDNERVKRIEGRLIMSMSTYIKGIKPPTAEYTKKVAAWLACEAAGVEIPKVVGDYFGWVKPNPLGMEVDLDEHESVTKYKGDMKSGFEVEIAKLPSGVTHVRFYNSW